MPLDPQEFLLEATVLQPAHNASVIAGREATVVVHGAELGERSLTGLGFVARQVAGGNLIKLDSVVVRFPARADSTHSFQLAVPPNLPVNSQINIYAVVFEVSGGAFESRPNSVVIIRCDDPLPICN